MCDSERGDLFFHEAGAVVGHLTERRYVSSVERLTSAELLFRSPMRRLSLEPQIYCAAPLNFIYAFLIVVYTEYLLLHIPKVEMVWPQPVPRLFTFADIVFDTQSILSE